MHKPPRLFFVTLLLFSFSPAMASNGDETDAGLSLSYEMEKSLFRNMSLSVCEEIRLVTNAKGFDRSATSAGLDYAFWDKRIKVGAFYEFLYLYNNKHNYEPRHRYYFNLSLNQTFGDFTLSWRGRVQGTYRQENIGEYNINPKYIMKNKFEIEYSIWGRPWKPYVSCDLSTELNDPMGNDLTRIRTEAGATHRINRTNYIKFFLRWDEYLVDNDPRVITLGAAYKMRF